MTKGAVGTPSTSVILNKEDYYNKANLKKKKAKVCLNCEFNKEGWCEKHKDWCRKVNSSCIKHSNNEKNNNYMKELQNVLRQKMGKRSKKRRKKRKK